MADKYVNTTPRPVHVGNTMLVPGVPTTIAEDDLKLGGFKALTEVPKGLDGKEIEGVDPVLVKEGARRRSRYARDEQIEEQEEQKAEKKGTNTSPELHGDRDLELGKIQDSGRTAQETTAKPDPATNRAHTNTGSASPGARKAP